MDSYSLFGGGVFGGFGEGEEGATPDPSALKSGRAWSPAGGDDAAAPEGASKGKDGRPTSPVFSGKDEASGEDSARSASPNNKSAKPDTKPVAEPADEEMTAEQVQALKKQVEQLKAEKAQLAALAAQTQAEAGGAARVAALEGAPAPTPTTTGASVGSMNGGPLTVQQQQVPWRQRQAAVNAANAGSAGPTPAQAQAQAAAAQTQVAQVSQAQGQAMPLGPGAPPFQMPPQGVAAMVMGPGGVPVEAPSDWQDPKRTGPPTRWPAKDDNNGGNDNNTKSGGGGGGNHNGGNHFPASGNGQQLRAGPDDAFRLDRPRGARMTQKWQKRWASGGWAGRPYMIGAKTGGQYKSGGEFAQVVLGVFCQVDRSQLRQVFNNMFIGCAAVLTSDQVRLVQAHPDVEYVRQASRDFM